VVARVLISEGAECAHFKETAAMKKTAIAFALLVTILASCEGVRAQKPALKSTPVTIAPDLTKLNIEKMLQQVQTANVQPSTQETSPIQVVAEFLQLQPGQLSTLEQLLQARQATLLPLLQTAQTLIQQLANVLNSGGNPAQVGVLVIQIHSCSSRWRRHSKDFSLNSWRSWTLNGSSARAAAGTGSHRAEFLFAGTGDSAPGSDRAEPGAKRIYQDRNPPGTAEIHGIAMEAAG
jgi:hypothetical protein